MISQSQKQTTPHPVREEQLYPLVNQALHRWGKYHYACYPIFQPIVELKLKIVEKRASQLVRLEANHSPSDEEAPLRDVTDCDRREAVWSLLREAIIGLEPSLYKFEPPTIQALQQLPLTGEWPRHLPVPPECWGYLRLSFAYVWKNKSTKEVARLLGISRFGLRTIRNAALQEVVQKLLAWEKRCATSLNFDSYSKR